MNRVILILTILLYSTCQVVAQEIITTSTITDVTVYRSLAKETRSSTVTIPEGNSEIVISGVSTLMTDQSLQVSVKGVATLLSATVRTNYFNEPVDTPKDAKAERLRDSIKVLDVELRWLSEERQMFNGEVAYINELLKPGVTKEAYKPVDLEACANMHRDRISGLKKKLFDLSLKEEALSERRTKFQAQLNEMGAKKSDPVKEIVLSFYAEKSASTQLRCTYLVSSAGWIPMYDIQVENTTKPVELTYKAKLFQRTGTDWKNINLTVSSANPSLNNNRPLMSPKYIDYATYIFQSAPSAGAITNMMQAERVDNLSSIDDGDPFSYEVSVLEKDIQVEFIVDIKQSIPSDGKEHICKLQNYSVPATYKYHAVPKLDPSAFLLARITDYGQYNLLAGDANIFFGDTYVGIVNINPQITTDTLLLSLGRDEKIVVKRVRVMNKTSKKTFSGVQKDTYAWETTIRNNKGVPIEIEILDQIPLSRRKEIVVKMQDKSGADYNEIYGKLLWDLKIPANNSKKVQLEYTVEYPEGQNVAEQ